MTATRYPNEPPGLVVFARRDGVKFLTFDVEHVEPPGSPWADARRTYGWYYGYPPCCVDAWIADVDADLAREREFAMRAHHPVSGHMLCRRCATGPRAPLRARPAREYGFALDYGDGPIFWEPSGDDVVPENAFEETPAA